MAGVVSCAGPAACRVHKRPQLDSGSSGTEPDMGSSLCLSSHCRQLRSGYEHLRLSSAHLEPECQSGSVGRHLRYCSRCQHLTQTPLVTDCIRSVCTFCCLGFCRLLQTASGLFAPCVVSGSAACYTLHQVCLHPLLSWVLSMAGSVVMQYVPSAFKRT